MERSNLQPQLLCSLTQGLQVGSQIADPRPHHLCCLLSSERLKALPAQECEQEAGLNPPGCLFPPEPRLLRPKEPAICGSLVFLSFSFLSPLSKTAWQPLLPLVPKAVRTGPSCPCSSDGGNSVNGKQDGWFMVPKVQEARNRATPGGGKENVAGTHPPLGPY